MFFSVAIYAPFVEEMIFRKSIKDIFSEYNDNNLIKYFYIITSGLIFSLLHTMGNATNTLDYLYTIPYLALGISLALTYYKTKNILQYHSWTKSSSKEHG